MLYEHHTLRTVTEMHSRWQSGARKWCGGVQVAADVFQFEALKKKGSVLCGPHTVGDLLKPRWLEFDFTGTPYNHDGSMI